MIQDKNTLYPVNTKAVTDFLKNVSYTRQRIEMTPPPSKFKFIVI